MDTMSFENISNFRDVGLSVNHFGQLKILKPGIFFRSARPDKASKNDRGRLLNDYHIKTIIDLRTTTEHINAAKERSEVAALSEPATMQGLNTTTEGDMKISAIDYADINLNGKGFERSLVWKLSYLSLAKVVLYMALGYRMDAVTIIAREVLQPRGLIGLGIDTIEHSGPEIKQVFDVLANNDSWPVLIHCTQGKDRTGMIVVLVLLLCEVNVEHITRDYTQSEIELAPEITERLKETSSIGLDESFSKCPNDFVVKIEEHITDKYGSVQGYLQNIGVDHSNLQRIKTLLQA